MFSADSTQVSSGSGTQGVPYVWGVNQVANLGIGLTARMNDTGVWAASTTRVGAYGISSVNSNGGWVCKTLFAIKQDGTFWAQGNNDYGQFGNNTRLQYSSYTYNNGLTKVRDGNAWAIVAGNQANMATKTDGTMWVCGDDDNGWLGVGSNGIRRSSPVQLAGTNWPTSDPKKVAVGSYAMYAVKTDGTLWGWGYNLQGQLGQNNVVSKSSPVQITSATNWKCVSAGSGTVLAVRTDGTLWAWGNGVNGSLGNGLSGASMYRSSPIQIGTDTNWSTVTCNYFSSYGVKTNGTLWAWGDNAQGQLGLGDLVKRSSPVQVGALTNWSDVYTGKWDGNATAFKKTDGTLWACGNTDGIWGISPGTASSPIQVGTFTDATSVAASTTNDYSFTTHFVIALRSDTGINLGQISNSASLYWSNAPIAPVPLLFSTSTQYKYISIGGYCSAGIKSDGTLWTWGYNGDGQLGDGTAVTRSSPVQIGALTTWSSVAGNSISMAAVKTDGTLWTWGSNQVGQLGINVATTVSRSSPVQVGALTNWTTVVGNSDASFATNFLALKSDGTLWAWGDGGYGALGQGNVVNKSSPVQIGTGTNWSYIATGLGFCVAIKTDGTMWAWGRNDYGGLGQNNIINRSSPVQIGAGTTWSKVACGTWSTWALKTDGTLWAFGYNSLGMLGTGNIINYSSPVQVGTLTNWSSVASGQANFLGVKTDGTMWGSGHYPGDGVEYRSSPVQVTSGTTTGTTTWLKPSPNGTNPAATSSNAGALKA